MLNDTFFVKTSIESGLFYLRLMRDFALNIRLSFYVNNSELISTAKDFETRYENFGKVITKYGKISKIAYDNQIFVTKYTLPTEKLTEKLFNIDLVTELTEKELDFEIGEFDIPSKEVIDELIILNNDALILTKNFVYFLSEISKNIDNNTLFSYLYQSLIDSMIEEANLYINILERIKKRESGDPTFVTDYVYRYQLIMRDISRFLRNFIDPREEEVFERFDGFAKSFQKVSEEYITSNLSPEIQNFLNKRTKVLVEEFKRFVSMIIQEVLDSNLHFIISPLFLDTVYREINYFKYLLESNE